MRTRIVAITAVVVRCRRYPEPDQVTVEWEDRNGDPGLTYGASSNRHIAELLRRAHREHSPVTTVYEEAA